MIEAYRAYAQYQQGDECDCYPCVIEIFQISGTG